MAILKDYSMTEVHATPADDGRKLTIAINGRFDFGAHQQFRDAYERVYPKPTTYVIDLAQANYLDSSALGMLLLLRDHAGGETSTVDIINSSSDVKKILAISNFDKLFNIS
jgi:anti-anti-sigma factor